VSYHIYTTSGIVLSARPTKEADRIYSILTRDFGLIRAEGKAVRKEDSKLRGAIEPFSNSEISLIKGRERWRITSAEVKYSLKQLNKNTFTAFARIFSLLQKLMAGEEKHPEIFDVVDEAARFVGQNENEDIGAIEILLLTRILIELGYFEELNGVSRASRFSNETLSVILASRTEFIEAINRGIEVSGLVKK
jgi:DNA repair protein RecO (recombination protein O)